MMLAPLYVVMESSPLKLRRNAMNWKVFAEEPPPRGKWQRYYVKTTLGEEGTAIYSYESGFYDVTVNGEKKPVGTPIFQWSLMQ